MHDRRKCAQENRDPAHRFIIPNHRHATHNDAKRAQEAGNRRKNEQARFRSFLLVSKHIFKFEENLRKNRHQHTDCSTSPPIFSIIPQNNTFVNPMRTPKLQPNFLGKCLFPHNSPHFVDIRKGIEILIIVVVKCTLEGHTVHALFFRHKTQQLCHF